MNLDDEKIYEFEGDYYQSPTSMRDDIMSFVDSFRNTVKSDTSNIARQTQNLGTDISPSLGGLGGSSDYFAQRYQTLPVEAQVSNLRATAQADALNKLMKNELAQTKKRYQNAYKAAQRRAASYGGSGGYYGGTYPDVTGGSDLNITTETGAPSTIDLNVNTQSSPWQATGVGTWKNKETGQTLSPGGSFIQALGGGGGMDLGVWPNGTKMTQGSTYTFGGKTYTYEQMPGQAYPSVFMVGGA